MPANHEQWGQYGDFVGGVFGTVVAFVSVYYLVRTLKEQQAANLTVSENNSLVAHMHTIQQIENNFQKLLQLYNKAVGDYAFDNEKGKKALEKWVSKLQGRPIDYTTNYRSRLNESLALFDEEFYIPNRVCAAVHFRVLYQFFNVNESSVLSKDAKIAYAKLVRGQIDEDEMLLIRYNCWSPNGRKMRPYVNHYNLLKHLPILNLLEFWYWRQNIFTDKVYRNAIDTELIAQRKWIKENFPDYPDRLVESVLSEKYKVKINWTEDKKRFTYTISRNRGCASSSTLDKALDLLQIDHTTDFFADFLRELFCYSNFGLFNSEEDLTFVKKDVKFDDDRQLEICEIDVLSKTELALNYEASNSRTPDESPEEFGVVE